jgi:ornithine cyclodeaminase
MTPRWLTEADVAALLDMSTAIGLLRDTLPHDQTGELRNMAKTHVTWGQHSTLHAVGAAFPAAGLAGTKTWAHTDGGASPLVALFDAEDGHVVAIVEAFVLGQLRTGAMSGLATDVLATTDAAVLGIVGTGKQALPQVAGVTAVRPLREVRVFGRDAGRRRQLAERVTAELGVAARPVESVAGCVGDADVVTLATRAAEWFLAADALKPGTHLNAIGAIVPTRQEFEPSLLDRAGVVAVDSVEQTRCLSHEFRTHLGDDDDRWARVRPLSQLLGSTRPPDTDLSIFKAMGIGAADVVLAVACLRQAEREDRGTPVSAASSRRT